MGHHAGVLAGQVPRGADPAAGEGGRPRGGRRRRAAGGRRHPVPGGLVHLPLPRPGGGTAGAVRGGRALPRRAPAGGRQTALPVQPAQRLLHRRVGRRPVAAGARSARPVAAAPARPDHRRRAAVLPATAGTWRLPDHVRPPRGAEVLYRRRPARPVPGSPADRAQPDHQGPRHADRLRDAGRTEQRDLRRAGGGAGRLGSLPAGPGHRQDPPVAGAHEQPRHPDPQRPVLPPDAGHRVRRLPPPAATAGPVHRLPGSDHRRAAPVHLAPAAGLLAAVSTSAAGATVGGVVAAVGVRARAGTERRPATAGCTLAPSPTRLEWR